MAAILLLTSHGAASGGRYRYAYLLGSLLFMALWALIVRRYPDLRREMLVMGALSVLCGLPQEYFLWTRDWWHPRTITGTRVGIEDVLFAVSNGGLMATLYTIVFRCELVPDAPPRSPLARVARLVPYLLLLAVPPLLVLAGIHSFAATTAGALAALTLILVWRPDLLPVALGSAGLALALALPVYWISALLFPGVIAATWDLPRLSGVLVFGVPLEDVLWYLYAAAFYGTYYKLLTGRKVV